jgi:hypothetical protein
MGLYRHGHPSGSSQGLVREELLGSRIQIDLDGIPFMALDCSQLLSASDHSLPAGFNLHKPRSKSCLQTIFLPHLGPKDYGL